MNFFEKLGASFNSAITTFRESSFSHGIQHKDEYKTYEARLLRYAVFWAYYENTAYSSLNNWSQLMKKNYGLYKYIRHIYNPASRIGDFWRTHLMGGYLDPKAGDGQELKSALPIMTDNDNVRTAISMLWKWSNWNVRRNIFTLQGTILGDVALKVVDDVNKGRVYLDVIHPSRITDLILDNYGNVKAYSLIDFIQDPRPERKKATVLYTEKASRDGEDVVFETFLNNEPFAWNGIDSKWSEPYGFIPLVMAKHIDLGQDWGLSELNSGRTKIQEADDLASKLGDQIRKVVDSPMLLAGVNPPSPEKRKVTGEDKTTSRPNPEREEILFLYSSSPQANAIPLIGNLDIAGASQHILTILDELEKTYPELQVDLAESGGGEASGRALRIARSKLEEKAQELRTQYDSALERAQMMAISIGGMRGYEGFSDFNIDSYKTGNSQHSIGKRAVFQSDPYEELERDDLFWKVANQAKLNGVPLELFLRWNGYDEKKIKELLENETYQLNKESKVLAVEAQRNFQTNPIDPNKNIVDLKNKNENIKSSRVNRN